MRDIGGIAPLTWRGPWDWVLLAEMSLDDREAFIAHNPPTPLELEAAKQAWRDLAREGWCWEDRLALKSVRRLAAPVKVSDEGPPVAILAMAGNPITLPRKKVEACGHALQQAAVLLGQTFC